MKTFFIAILFAIPALAEDPASVEKKTPAEGKPAIEEKTSVEAKASVETATTPEPKLEPYKLKNRSSFTLSREARAPFWPIGWNKSKSTDPYQPRVTSTGVLTAKKKFEIQPQHFSVTSVLVGKPALATINGRSFAEGEVLPVIAGTERLRVVLKAVRDGGVWLEHATTQIYVPIRRFEVDATRSVEQPPQSAEFSIQIGGQVETSKAAVNDAINEALKR
jgi:hypothetical protein